MRPFIKYIKDMVIGGIFFLVPLFVFLIIIGKVWQRMAGLGHKFSALLGIKPGALGSTAEPIVTSLFILIICFISGLLLRVSVMNRLRNKADRLLAEYIPGYEFYKMTLEQKIKNKNAPVERPVVLITKDGIGQPGVIIEELPDSRIVVFIPAKPGTPEGLVYVVPADAVLKLDLAESKMNAIIHNQGKGLGALVGGTDAK